MSPSLASTLNELLTALDIPLTLQTPTDLTPSLLLAILESLIQSHLPISPSLRKSTSPAAKIQAMKIFLGVLGNDILQTDVGLSDVDPRRLARGEWDEVVFVGGLLCWLGHKLGFLAQPYALPLRSTSPSTQCTNLSMHSVVPSSSDTSVAVPSESHSSHTPLRPVPRCIHEVEEPTIVLPTQYHDSFADPTTTFDTSSSTDCPGPMPVRYTGWIDEVDVDLEVQSFESTRRSYRPSYPRGGNPGTFHVRRLFLFPSFCLLAT